MIRNKIILPATLGLTLIGGILFAATVGAQTPSDGTQTIIQKIATRFNLNEADVKQVFDEQMKEHHAQMKQNLETKLTQAVTDDKITEAQKAAILAKFGEPFTRKVEPGQQASKEEMQKLKDQKKAEMESWAKENGLSLETLKEVLGHNGPGFGGKKMMFFAH